MMPIIGVTHGKDHQPITRLQVNVKVSIGRPASADRKYPEKLDHFAFATKDGKGEWVENPEITKLVTSSRPPDLTGPMRSVPIIFLSDDIDEIFRTEYAWWSASERKCHGDGEKAVRKLSALTEVQLRSVPKGATEVPWIPCGDDCPDLQARRCKPSGALHFMLADRPVIGSIAAYYTTSYQSVRNIHSSLVTIRELTKSLLGAPRLKGIRLQLVMVPGKTRYADHGGQRKTGSAWFVAVEFKPDEKNNLLPELVQQGLLYERVTREARLIGAGAEIEDIPEPEKARIMGTEFYQPDTPDAEPESAKITAELDGWCKELDLNDAKRDVLLGAANGDVGAAVAFLKRVVDYREALKATPREVGSWVVRGAKDPAWLWAKLDEAVAAAKEKERPAPAPAPAEPAKRSRPPKVQATLDAHMPASPRAGDGTAQQDEHESPRAGGGTAQGATSDDDADQFAF